MSENQEEVWKKKNGMCTHVLLYCVILCLCKSVLLQYIIFYVSSVKKKSIRAFSTRFLF